MIHCVHDKHRRVLVDDAFERLVERRIVGRWTTFRIAEMDTHRNFIELQDSVVRSIDDVNIPRNIDGQREIIAQGPTRSIDDRCWSDQRLTLVGPREFAFRS